MKMSAISNHFFHSPTLTRWKLSYANRIKRQRGIQVLPPSATFIHSPLVQLSCIYIQVCDPPDSPPGANFHKLPPGASFMHTLAKTNPPISIRPQQELMLTGRYIFFTKKYALTSWRVTTPWEEFSQGLSLWLLRQWAFVSSTCSPASSFQTPWASKSRASRTSWWKSSNHQTAWNLVSRSTLTWGSSTTRPSGSMAWISTSCWSLGQVRPDHRYLWIGLLHLVGAF